MHRITGEKQSATFDYNADAPRHSIKFEFSKRVEKLGEARRRKGRALDSVGG